VAQSASGATTSASSLCTLHVDLPDSLGPQLAECHQQRRAIVVGRDFDTWDIELSQRTSSVVVQGIRSTIGCCRECVRGVRLRASAGLRTQPVPSCSELYERPEKGGQGVGNHVLSYIDIDRGPRILPIQRPTPLPNMSTSHGADRRDPQPTTSPQPSLTHLHAQAAQLGAIDL
jgi:hypothetical protein